MGILNVTPDSFSDGGRYVNVDRALEHARTMIDGGARIIDVGGESTRPGAQAVDEQEEIRRVVPLMEALAAQTKAIVSVDTSKAAVIRAALQAGASMVNDVRALREEGALEAVAASDAGVCLMHMQGEPRTMQSDPQYIDVVAEVKRFLADRVGACVAAGIGRDRIVLDPGIGFGKRVEHNMQLLAALPDLLELRLPLLIGVSRKSMFATLLGRSVEQRLAGGLALAVSSVLAGASVLRVHDVAETVDAVKMAAELKKSGYRI
ncbi:dihydropteroate synthase [Povalibacter uvarum]|uniref:Dihydropteroate synthase n=1 Tax=Povalibacter uvarum TaxID=732238 RepID=A0A841HHJ3_9GAMM|nr:dihydropteroate synthase [Povalibacter uvarum]MBB6091879.1 dihydropteroate synthase [Povalibacter uvarum]